MPYYDKTLLEAAKNAGRKLVSNVGDSAVAKYIGYEIVEDEKFGGLKYQFKFKLADGSTKLLSTRAGRVLEKLARIPKNAKVKVTKLADGNNTDYSFKLLSSPKQAAPVEDEEEEEVIQVDEQEEAEESEEDEEEDDEEILDADF